MKVCDKCGTVNSGENKHCEQCGTVLPISGMSASGETVYHKAGWQQMANDAGRGVCRSIPVESLFDQRQRVVIGRSPEADIYLPHSTVSRFHAELVQSAGGLLIRDSHSVNGVHLNGHPLQEAAPLKDQDRVGIGPFLFHVDGDRLLILDNSRSLRLQARNLEKVVRDPSGKPKKLLDNISLVIEPGEFVSLLGPSGSGKSTLMDCLNGRRPASGGLLLANGENFYLHYDSFRQSLGYVPQRDIVHTELSVYRALRYTALLRLPSDTDKKELNERIEEVLRLMELTPHRDTLIRNLSGGQIKRISLGAELIARPCLLFIDEATSGLDAGTEARMMNLFRDLANEGRSVICITHNVDNVSLCNLIIVLARGKLIFYGPPSEALIWFHVSHISEIYDQLQSKEPEVWEREYMESSLYQIYVQKRLSATERMREWQVEEEDEEEESPDQSSVFTPLFNAVSSMNITRAPLPHNSQFWILMARNLELLFRDRSTFRLLLLQAPIVAMFILLGFSQKNYDEIILAPRTIKESERQALKLISLGAKSAYNANKEEINEIDPEGKIKHYVKMLDDVAKLESPIIPERLIVNPLPTYILLFLMAIVVLWFGCNNAAKELVKENAIYRRERDVNLGIFAYLSSKFLVLSAITAMQTALLMVLVFGTMELLHAHLGMSAPQMQYMLPYPEQFGVLVLLAMTGVALGLCISAFVRNPDQASTLLPYVLIPQVILGGGVLAVKSGPLLYVAMILSPAYWAYRGVRAGETELPADFPVAMNYADHLWIVCAVLMIQMLAVFGLTLWKLKRLDIQRG